MAEVIIAKDNFGKEVMQSAVPVLIDFWATWCGPCKMIAPVLEEIAKDYEGKLTVGKVDVDEEPDLAAQFRVASIPMLVLMKNGAVADTLIGYRPKAQIEDMIKQHL